METKIVWCFKKAGAKIIEPNENMQSSFTKLSIQTLKSAEMTLGQKDFVWATSMIYYAEYYALYSLLLKLGVKSENHECSLEIAGFLMDKSIDLKGVKRAKKLRIDAQYYLKTVSDDELQEELRNAKIIVNDIINIINKLSTKEIKEYRNKLLKLIKS